MAGIGLLHGIHGENREGIGHVAVVGDGGGLESGMSGAISG